MKMIIAIVEDTSTDRVSEALLGTGFRVTQLATTGGFLREGATTRPHRLIQSKSFMARMISPSSWAAMRSSNTLVVVMPSAILL